MIIVKNGTLVRDIEEKADVAVSDGKIVRISGSIAPTPGDTVIDATDSYVFPGFIDAHTHFQMTNALTTTADSFETGTKAALAGGTTTIINFASPVKGGTLRAAYDRSTAMAEGHSSCNYRFHMEIVDFNDGLAREIAEMPALGITSFKVYMAYDIGVSDCVIYDALKEIRKIGGLLGAHCENGDFLRVRTAELLAAGESTPAAHPKSHPDIAEAEAVSRLAYIGKLAGYPVHVVHLSSKAGLAELRKARASDIDISAETCPQYLLLDASLYERPGFEGAKYVMSPPLREAEDREALLEAIRNCEIQTIATDHCSYRFDTQKTIGLHDFSRIPGGIPGVEHRVPLMYTKLVCQESLPVTDLVRLMAENPAKMYGMYPRKGILREGSDADIVVYEKSGTHRIRAAEQTQNLDYTPYEGLRVTGKVRHVLLNGIPVLENGLITKPFTGVYVK